MRRRHFSDRGDRILDRNPVRVGRYRLFTRINHWIIAASTILLLLSGLAFYWPSLFWLTALFGGGQAARWLHPILGLVLAVGYLLMFVQLVARNIRPNEIVPFHAGTYHVVSQYGRLNAEVRADFMVEPGKVTKATIVHRAARITFKLVKVAGGDAIANTAWSILTESGDVITESNSAFPAFVLSEGTYSAIAKNADKIYSREFTVEPGVNRDVEVLSE